MEGTILGVPSFAISLAGDHPFIYDSAVPFAIEAARYILNKQLPYDTLLNVNVPNLPKETLKGIRITKQGKRMYDNAIQDIYSPWEKSITGSAAANLTGSMEKTWICSR